MANDVQYLIDMLYEMIDGAKGVLMAPDKCTIVREDALDLLDELRGQLPVELKKAQDLLRARDEYVEGAKKEAEKIRRQADQDAKTIVGESEIMGSDADQAGALLPGLPQHLPVQSDDWRGQRVHRRRSAAHGGGDSDGAGGGQGVQGPVPRGFQ